MYMKIDFLCTLSTRSDLFLKYYEFTYYLLKNQVYHLFNLDSPNYLLVKSTYTDNDAS